MRKAGVAKDNGRAPRQVGTAAGWRAGAGFEGRLPASDCAAQLQRENSDF